MLNSNVIETFKTELNVKLIIFRNVKIENINCRKR